MTTNDLIRMILEARSFERLRTLVERALQQEAEEFEAAKYESDRDALGQD